MSRYHKYGVTISKDQKDKIKAAIDSGSSVSNRLKHEDLQGSDILALSQSQLTKIANAHQEGKGFTIKMSRAQLSHYMKVEGGFLGTLAGPGMRALPAIA